MSDLTAVEEWAAGVLAQLEPGQRRKLARAVGTDVARSQRDRIKAARNPDGSPYEARKPRETMRDRKGELRRKAKAGPMFAKLSRAAELAVVEVTGESVSVGFRRARSARIARVHQFGLVDQVERKSGSPRVRYPARQLLGLTEADRSQLIDRIVAHIGTEGR